MLTNGQSKERLDASLPPITPPGASSGKQRFTDTTVTSRPLLGTDPNASKDPGRVADRDRNAKLEPERGEPSSGQLVRPIDLMSPWARRAITATFAAIYGGFAGSTMYGITPKSLEVGPRLAITAAGLAAGALLLRYTYRTFYPQPDSKSGSGSE